MSGYGPTGRKAEKPVLLSPNAKRDLLSTLCEAAAALSTVWAQPQAWGPLVSEGPTSDLALLMPVTWLGQGAAQTQMGQCPPRKVPTGAVNAETRQPMGMIWVQSHFQLQIYLIGRTIYQLTETKQRERKNSFFHHFFFFKLQIRPG